MATSTASVTDKTTATDDTATITATDHDDDLWYGMDITGWKPLTIDDKVRMKL